MIKRKKLLSLVLTLALGVSVFAGCAKTEEKTEEPAVTEKAAEETTKAEEMTEAATEAEAVTIDWPTKTINFIVPSSAGGPTDILSRIIGEATQKSLDQPIIITNIRGVAGTHAGKEAAPDGYNFLVNNNSFLVSNVFGAIDYNHDAFEPVATLGIDTTPGIFVRNDSPLQTIEDLVNALKAEPESLTAGVFFSSSPHLHAMAFEQAAGVKLHVIDTGTDADTMVALLGGQIDVAFSQYATNKGYLESGDVRYLGVASKERSEVIPDVPTYIEQGVDLVFPGQSLFVLAPKGTDPAIIELMNKAVNEGLKDQKVVDQMTMMASTIYPSSVEGTKQFLDEMLAKFQEYKSLIEE